FLGIPNDRQFLAMAGYRLRHLFPCPPKQPGYNKRLRRLTAEIERTINYLAFHSPGFCDSLAAARHDAGPLRSVARDGAALGARRNRRLRLLPQPFPLLLGLPPLPAL